MSERPRVTDQLDALDAARFRYDLAQLRYDLTRLQHELLLRVANTKDLASAFGAADRALGEVADRI